MDTEKAIQILAKRKFYNGRMIAWSKSTYRKAFPEHLIYYNCIIYNATTEEILIRKCDINFSLDMRELYHAVLEISDDIMIASETGMAILTIHANIVSMLKESDYYFKKRQ